MESTPQAVQLGLKADQSTCRNISAQTTIFGRMHQTMDEAKKEPQVESDIILPRDLLHQLVSQPAETRRYRMPGRRAVECGREYGEEILKALRKAVRK
jgi:hypothetical protein